MHVGIRRLTLRATQCHSLKEKRTLLRKLDGRVRARYHIPLAEVGAQNDWQYAIIGYAVVGSDRVSVERQSTEMARFIERTGLAEVIRDEHELTAYGEGPMGEDGVTADVIEDPSAEDPMAADWIPQSWKTEDTVG